MSRPRLDLLVVTLVILSAVGVAAYLALHTDSSPSRFERTTCDGARSVRVLIDANPSFASLQRAIRAMAHSAGRVELDPLRIHAIRARTHMHRVHYQAVLAGVASADTLPFRAVGEAGPGARREWRHVERALTTVRQACHRLGAGQAAGVRPG